MYAQPTLATRFASSTRVLRSEFPLAETQMRQAAPSIFAEGKHISRSQRYTYIPTIDVLHGLQREGFEPFMVAQGNSRIEGKTEYTKHMIRMRHVARDGGRPATPEANEIILINSHDGASSYQLLAGKFRFVCCNGMVVGEASDDIRIAHKGDVRDEVISGAFRVLDNFAAIDESAEAMKVIDLHPEEERAFARAAITLRYGVQLEGQPPRADHRRAAAAGAPAGGSGQQSVAEPAARAGACHPRWTARPNCAGPSHAHPRSRQHRPQRQPEPCVVGAGRGDAQAEGLKRRARAGRCIRDRSIAPADER